MHGIDDDVSKSKSKSKSKSNPDVDASYLIPRLESCLHRAMRESNSTREIAWRIVAMEEDRAWRRLEESTSSFDSMLESRHSRRLFGAATEDRGRRGDLGSLLRDASSLWTRGIRGGRVRVGLLDTGLRGAQRGFETRLISHAWDLTDEGTVDDLHGHGTFIAGIVASSARECPGFAPDASVYVLKVFNAKQGR